MRGFFFIITFTLSMSLFGETYQIEMLNKDGRETMTFKPRVLKVQPGDKVIFIPTSKGHNTQSVYTPKNAQSWNGKISEKVELTFKEEGIYIYECKNHGIMGMAGIIQVGKNQNANEAKQFFERYRKKFITNKERLDYFFKDSD